jgi:chromate reductase, NAD(P)H dehydrogenase (quinone)
MAMGAILILAASTGNNLELARLWASVADEESHSYEIVDLCSLDFPLFTPALQKAGAPDGLSKLESKMAAADAWVICAPEYNGSIPPSLNNAIAWLSTNGEDFRGLFNGKAVGLSTYSGGGGDSVIAAMRMQFSYLGCNIIGRSVLSNRNKEANPDAMKYIISQLIS